MALVLYSFSSVFKDTERCIRQKGSHCNYENLLLSLPQSKCIHILSDIKKKHEQRGSHPSFLSVTTTDTTTSSRRERANTSRPHSFLTQRSQGRDSRGISWQNLLECCWLAFSQAAEFLYLVDAPSPHRPRLVLEPLVSIISQGSLMASKATDQSSPYFVQLRGHLLWPCGLCQKKN